MATIQEDHLLFMSIDWILIVMEYTNVGVVKRKRHLANM